MRRAIWCLVCLTLVLGVCVGAIAQAKGPYTVKMWVFPLGDSNAQKALFADMVKRFESQNKDIKVNVQTMPWSNREQKLMTALAANRGPDSMYMNSDILLQFAYNNMLLPLDRYLTADQKNDFFPHTLSINSYEGKVYGVPILQELMTYIYNMDMLKSIGMDAKSLPTTFDEYEAMMSKLAANGMFGLAMDVAASPIASGYYAQLWSEGGNPFAPDGKVTINDATGVKVLERLARWYKNGYLPKDSVTMTEESYGKWLAGQAASFYFSAGYLVGDDLKNVKFTWALGPILKGAAGAKTDCSIGSFCLTKDSTNPKAAFTWLDFVTNKENSTALNKFSGFLPPRKSIPNIHAAVKGYDVILSQLQYSYSLTSHPVERQIIPYLIPEIQAALTGAKTAQQAMNDAAARAHEIIKRYEDIKAAQQ
jgi:multiple sugar transport system substrate-binding protein